MSTLALYGALPNTNGTNPLDSSNFTQDIINKSDEIKKNHIGYFITSTPAKSSRRTTRKIGPKPPKK